MAKLTFVLGIIGILLGTAGLGVGYIAWENQADLQTRLINVESQDNQSTSYHVWSTYEEAIFTPTELIFQSLPNMSQIIDISDPVSLYLIFTTSAKIIPEPSSFSDILFYFILNNERMENPFTRVGSFQGTASYEYHSVSLTQFFNVMSPGTYNFSISVFSESAGNFIRESSLTILSFPSS